MVMNCFSVPKLLTFANQHMFHNETLLEKYERNPCVFLRNAQNLTSKLDGKLSNVFNAHRGKFGSHLLNVVLVKTCA